MTARLHALLRRATGMDLPPQTLNAALQRRCKETGLADMRAYEAHVLNEPNELAALIDLVVVPESWFFRDDDAFRAAIGAARQRLSAGAATVRMLSVPCACGEEPYSMAMAVLDAGIDPGLIEIDAVDVSPRNLECARNAVYHRNAFRSRDLSFRNRHFSVAGGAYRLHQEVRDMVRFSCASLLDLAPPQAYDIVFCRNLLIYFDPPVQKRASARLQALLRDDGILFAGYAETLPFSQNGFSLLSIPRAFALRKTPAPPAAAPPSAPEPRAAARPARAFEMNQAEPPPGKEERAGETSGAGLAAMLARARLLADHGQAAPAMAAYLDCLQQAPDSVEACFMLGLLHEQAGDDAGAERYLRRASYLDPDHYDALCHLALLAERGGDAQAAARYRGRAARVLARTSNTRTDK